MPTNESGMKDTLFKQFVRATGRNMKQIVEAGGEIGLTFNRSNLLSRGISDPTLTERLAMSALRAGLDPWSEDYDQELQRIARFVSRPPSDRRVHREDETIGS